MNSQNKSDVLVVGMGMAGLMAAYTAAQRGKRVTLLATGLGALSIASGCVDVLGYLPNTETMSPPISMVQSPVTALDYLPPEHPYSIIGKESVIKALESLQELFTAQCADCITHGQNNTLVPTIIGTLKPTFFYPAASDSSPLFVAKRVLVVSVDAIRDCHPQLIAQQLQNYPALKDVRFSTVSLSSHFGAAHRAVSALDVARYVDSPEGFAWLSNSLAVVAKDIDAILLPPILGTGKEQGQGSVWKKLQDVATCPLVEMVSLPPGVGGNRLFSLFIRTLRGLQDKDGQKNVRIIENATIMGAEISQGRCLALIAQAEGVAHSYEAASFIIASGGILGGGIYTKPGKAYESILNIDLEMPAKVEEWASNDAFGSHAFTKMGVRVNEHLQPVDRQGKVLVENVYFAGRTLGGYDFATEKSGNGVAVATAWRAAQNV